jgi:hypothetical protein
MNTPIAVWSMTNTASLNVWEMHNDEAMFVGINDDKPEWFEIEYQETEEGELSACIDFHGTYHWLNECMRVN